MGKIAFDQLKQSLLYLPVPVYPDFDVDFTMERDASVEGLGAIFSQLSEEIRWKDSPCGLCRQVYLSC